MADNRDTSIGPLAVRLSEEPPRLDGWVVPPHTAARRKRGRGSEGRTGAVISQPLVDLVQQFAAYCTSSAVVPKEASRPTSGTSSSFSCSCAPGQAD